MTENTRIVHATPDRVWRVLSDGWLYPLWVVGATRIREVDDTWPAVGSRLHHSVGLWPMLLDDDTEVTDANPGLSLSLRARAWPTGEAAVHIHLGPHGPDTEVRMEEDVVSGPGRLVPPPLRGVTLKWRNTESLRRLAYLAERRR
jgi:polyketide cyclase/dehydrase/lipid transport protein